MPWVLEGEKFVLVRVSTQLPSLLEGMDEIKVIGTQN